MRSKSEVDVIWLLRCRECLCNVRLCFHSRVWGAWQLSARLAATGSSLPLNSAGDRGTGNCCRELVSSQKINQVFWALSCRSYLELFILLAYNGFHFNCTVTLLVCLVVALDNFDCAGLERKQTICTQVTGVSQSAAFVLDWSLGFGLRIFFPYNKLILSGFPQIALSLTKVQVK